MVDVLMTAPEVMEYLKISKVTLYKWMKHKKLPFHKLGGRYRYRRSEIDKWISKR
jgi:excisionase family DNA binding protein